MSGSETGVISSSEPYTVGFQKNPSLTPSPVQNIRLYYNSDGKHVYQPITGSVQPYVSSAGCSIGSAGNVALPHNLNMNFADTSKRKRGRPRKYVPDGSMALSLVSPPHAVPATMYTPASGAFSPPLAGAVTAQAIVSPGVLASQSPSFKSASAPMAGAVAAPAIVSPGVLASQSPSCVVVAPAIVSPGVLASQSPSFKRARGRPPGSSNKQHIEALGHYSSKKQHIEALGSAGVGFTPHFIIVHAGEDVSSKIMSFSQQGSRAVCILSASGAISNVSLRQASTCGGTTTYEGRFDILSLSGSFLLTDVGGQQSRSGGLSITLAGPDGRAFGGCVAGLLTAASPVQVIVGSFIADGHKQPKPVNQMEPLSVPHQIGGGGGGGGSMSPPSHGTLSESDCGVSTLYQSTGTACVNNANPTQGLTMSSIPWK